MYQEFLLATKRVAEMIGKKKFMFARQFNRQSLVGSQGGFMPPKNVDSSVLLMTFEDVVARLRPAEKIGNGQIEENISIEEKIFHVRQLLSEKVNFIFSQIIAKAKDKTEIIVGFLAILELMKQRELLLDQTELFGEIQVSRNV